MSNANLDQFIHKIISINATTVGMGAASAGVRGGDNIGEDTLNRLKKVVFEFAAEYTKSKTDQERLDKLCGEIEGLLRTLQVMSTITSQKSDDLLEELDSLIDAKGNIL